MAGLKRSSASTFRLPTTLALRVVGRMVDSDGYQTNVAPGPLIGSKLGGEDTRNVRLSAVWDITDSVENYTVLSWDDKDTNGRGMVLQAVNRLPTPGNGTSSVL